MYPRNKVCFRYVIVNTLHTGDNKDNNNSVMESRNTHREVKANWRDVIIKTKERKHAY
jgi:hypothetical protein